MLEELRTTLYRWMLNGSVPDPTSPWAPVIVVSSVIAVLLIGLAVVVIV